MKPLEELGISPAPWKRKYGALNSLRVDSACGACVADDLDLVEDKTGDSNARLIAAAPELYEALRLCVGELCETCRQCTVRPCVKDCEAVRKARAALEKAGGKE